MGLSITKIILFCFLSGQLLFNIPAMSKTFTVGLQKVPPFVVSKKDKKDKKNTGLLYEFFTLLSKQTKHTYKFVELPSARINIEFELGSIDIEPGVHPDWRVFSMVPSVYSNAYTEELDVIIYYPGNELNVYKVHDLFQRTVGIVRGYVYPSFTDVALSHQVLWQHAANEEQLLLMLARQRFKQAFINKRIAEYYAEHRTEYQKLKIGNVISRTPVSLRFQHKYQYLMDNYNEAIRALTISGELKQLFQSSSE